MKNLYCIRHGWALHNELFKNNNHNTDIFYNKKYYDTPLTEKGISQAKELSKSWNDKYQIELVLVSPLTRTLQTAEYIFNNTDIPIIAFDYLKEYPQGLHTCNKRSDLSILKDKFKNIDFSNICSEEDNTWDPNNEETIDKLNQRINKLKKYIESSKYNKIALISHSGFIGQLKDNHIRYIENGETELKYCFPYLLKL